MDNKRLIICGPTCSGKTYLRNKLEKRGFIFDVSYTTREPRPGEIDGVHYRFITKEWFFNKFYDFYEWAEYNGSYYGTGSYEWNNYNCFIMETEGINKISLDDRKNCFIVFLNPSKKIREKRMRVERKWDKDKINDRLHTDEKKFKGFNDYDVIITDPNF